MKLIFIYDISLESNSAFLSRYPHFVQHHVLKRLFIVYCGIFVTDVTIEMLGIINANQINPNQNHNELSTVGMVVSKLKKIVC